MLLRKGSMDSIHLASMLIKKLGCPKLFFGCPFLQRSKDYILRGFSTLEIYGALNTVDVTIGNLDDFRNLGSYSIDPPHRVIDPELHTYFTTLAQTYGPIFSLRLGMKLVVVISLPAQAKEVLKDHDAVFANHEVPIAARVATYRGHNIVWSPYGPAWRLLRKVCVRQMLCATALDAMHGIRRQEIRQMIWGLTEKMGTTTTVNIGEEVFLVVMRVVTGVERRMRKCAKWLDRIFEKVTDKWMRINSEGAEGRKEEKDFLEVLLQMRDDYEGEGRRICAGRGMAEKMVLFSLASLLHSFDCKIAGRRTVKSSGEVRDRLEQEKASHGDP
uniref:Cytochrome P450 n=1 Tax=Chenopodium quinoa TaxID=63459 RepID=A0A803L6G4_CHEQI